MRPARGSGRDLLRSAGRVALWACVALIFVRGLGAIARGPATSPTANRPVTAAAKSWPDDEARAFATVFAREYLTWKAGGAAERQRRLAPYLPAELRDRAAASLPRRGPGELVAEATVARVDSLGGARALITVACVVANRSGTATRYLGVPVARAANGGLVIFDLPSLSAPPGVGTVPAADVAPLSGSDAGAIKDVARRFLTAYLGGQDTAGLSYLLAPGAAVAALGSGYRLVSVDGFASTDTAAGARRAVTVAVLVRDTASRAVYPLRYALTLVRRDRWYVASVEGGAA